MKLLSLALLFAALAWCSPGSAQGTADTTAGKGSAVPAPATPVLRDSGASQTIEATRPQVELEVQSDAEDVTKEITFAVRVLNATKAPVVIREITLCLPAEILSARGLSNADCQIVKCSDAGDQEPRVQQAEEKICEFRLDQFKPNLGWDLVSFTPRKYAFRVQLIYSLNAESSTHRTYRKMEASFQPPLLSLILGGIVGSILLGCFQLIYSLVNPATGEGPFGNIGRKLVDSAGKTLAGAITATTLLFLLFRMKDLQLPVNLAINDFFGGIVLGLFTFRLGRWLYKQLLVESP